MKQPLIKSTLGDYRIEVRPEASKSHIIFRVEVPEETEEVVIHYSFSPVVEEEPDRLDIIFNQHRMANNMEMEDRKYIDSIRNIVTVSARSETGYEGSCHRFEPKGEILINHRESTPGMRTRPIVSGLWDISFNFHALVTEQTTIHCTIEALHVKNESELTPIQINKVEKQRLVRDRLIEPLVQKVELHSHTNHSDASHASSEMMKEAIDQDIQWLAITDHNTLSAFDEKNIDGTTQVIQGLEMTTFHGHFLTLGYEGQDPVDWTTISRSNISKKLRAMKAQGLTIGIAHPFDVGSPYCTGCRWQYILENLEYIDFLEVWNGENPQESLSNADAYSKWTQLLNQGIEIPATCGRDWHHSNTDKKAASMYVLTGKESNQKDILHAVKMGRSYITMGPQLEMHINHQWTFGDRIGHLDDQELVIHFQMSVSNSDYSVKIESNVGDLFEISDSLFSHTIDQQHRHGLKWLRIAVYDQENTLHAFTNPVYFSNSL